MDAVSEIKQHLDIVTVVSSYVALKKSGRNYKGVCPFHSENTPSFMVSPELQIYKCFGCNAAGDMFNFIQQIEGVDFPQALELLADRAGIKIERNNYETEESALRKRIYYINEITARFYNYILTNHAGGKIGRDYIKDKRKLTDVTINDFLIGYAPDLYDALINFLMKKGISIQEMLTAGVVAEREQGKIVDKFRGRVVFPFMGTDGKIVGFAGRTVLDRDPKYLNTSETLVFHKSRFIFGLDKARIAIKKEGAVFVEGQMDLISAHQHGFTNVIATSGTSLTEDHLNILSRYTNDITFCFDSDTAGVSAIFRGVEMAERHGYNIKIAVIPVPYKDIDEMLQSDPLLVKQMFATAVPAYDFYLYSILKKYDKTSPEGKKRIMDELIPKFKTITNKVLFDHYAKQIATELNLAEETVVSVLAKGADRTNTAEKQYVEEVAYQNSESSAATGVSAFNISKQHTESYIISLLLKANLDITTSMGYKLTPEDFSDKDLSRLFSVYIEYIRGLKGDFHPHDFEKLLDTDLKEKFKDLYLWEDPNIASDANLLAKEIDSVIDRLKKESSKKRMKELTEEIRIAEKSGDTKHLNELMDEFKKLKEHLM